MHSNNLIIMKIQLRNYLENLFFSSRKVSNQKGFSLIEVIFSIGIITAGTIPLLLLFSYNVRNAADNKNKLVAIYLAEESIEIVRQIRDSNWFSGDDWDDNFDNIQSTNQDGITGLENVGNINFGWEVQKVAGGGNQWKKKVYRNINNNYYAQSANVNLSTLPLAWEYTGFERVLKIDENSDDSVVDCFGIADCMKVTSRVYFRGDLIAEAAAYLYDKWY